MEYQVTRDAWLKLHQGTLIEDDDDDDDDDLV
jgi:hypothetical protein